MKRVVSLLLALSMLLSLLSVGVFAAEGEAFTIDFGTYKKETAYTEDNARYYLTSNTEGENWKFDAANTTNKAYYDNTTSGCRLQSQITVARYSRDDGVSGFASVAFKFTAPASGTYDVTTDVYARTVCGYVDVHIIDGTNKIYIGRMDNYSSSNKDVTKNLLSVTLEKDKEYSIAYTPSEISSGTAASLYVYRANFTPTSSPAALGVEVTASKTTLLQNDTATVSLSASLTNGGLYSLETAGAVISYESSDTAIATVTNDGVVTAGAEGEATITAKAVIGADTYTDTVDITVTDELPPPGSAFSVDFRSVDRSTLVTPSNTTSSSQTYCNKDTRGENWTIDTSIVNKYFYAGTSYSVRIQDHYAYIGQRGAFGINFTVEDAGKYDIVATVYEYTSTNDVDFYIDGVYVGTIASKGTALAPKTGNLLGVELTAGTHSLIIFPDGGNAFVQKLDFTPVHEHAKISSIETSVENASMFVGTEQTISLAAVPSVEMRYDSELGMKNFDGSAGVLGAITYSGYDENILSVSAEGKITALAAGNTTITVAATVNGTPITDTIDIEVKLPVIETVNITAPKYILSDDADGEALTVTAKMTNGADVDMSKAAVVYESLNTKAALVSDAGVVTPVKEGSAEIKVTVTYEGSSAESTVEIPITKEPLPDGTAFVIDFGTVDISTAYTEDNTRYYARAGTRGENWALDTANTTSSTYYDNKTQGIRVAQPGLTAFNRTGDRTGNSGFAIKFTAPETGIYDINAAITMGPTCGYVDAYLIDGATKTYIGSYDSWDVSSSYPNTDADLLGVSLEGGREYSLQFYQSSSGAVDDRVYLTSISFTPVKVPSEVVGIDASVEDNNIAAGESVDLIAKAITSNGVIYEVEKSKKNADGGLTVAYRSSDDNIATVSDTGVIKGVAPGKVNITAELPLAGGTVSKDVQITVNANTYDRADVNIDEESVYIVGGRHTLVPAAILSDGNGAALRDITARYESDNEGIAKIEDGSLVAVAEGKCEITAYVTFNGIEKSVKKTVTVENVKLAGIEAALADNLVTALDPTGSQINVNGVLNNGERINLADAMFTYETLTPDIVSVDENGIAYYVSRGVGKVKVSAVVEGNTFECECEVTSSSQKEGPTIYTEQMRAQALENAAKYDWAKSLVKTAKANADVVVNNLDKIYDMVPVEGVPRASGNATWNSGEDYEYICPYCKKNLQLDYGSKPWKINPLNRPWKVQCPDCKNLFPSNDFESFYKLGITEDGVFDRELALQRNQAIVDAGGKGYLVNELYPDVDEELGIAPDKVDTWMVDDGFGWSDVDGTYGTNTLPKFNPVAHYAHLFWDNNGTANSFFTKGIQDLRDAYLYTGEEKYGRAGVILLDRVADVYPDFDLPKYSLAYPNSHGLGYNGKLVGSIWETNILDVFNTAYDAFYPMTDDAQAIEYLAKKAQELGLENPKTSADMIRENMENGILRETFNAVKKSQSNGNFGMHQLNLTYAAVALDTQPETDEMFDWLGRYSVVTRGPIVDPVYGGTWNGFKSANSGGDILLKYVRDVDRDGFGNEVGLGYNALWLNNGLDIAETINRYDATTDLNLFENPKYVKMFSAFVRETLGDGYSIHLGDSGRVGGPSLSNYGTQALRAFNATKNPELAQVYYFYQGGELDDVYIDIFTDNDGLKEEIQNVIDTYGEYELVSENMTGFGLAVLRGGELIKASSGTGSEQRYDTWLYSGITGGHGHYDSLALGIDAYGFNFMPDGGYPENTGYNPNRLQWASATISHNTVVVNNDNQAITSGSKPLHFDSTDKVKLVDVSSPSAYSATDIYRRTAVTIEASSKDVYTLDFFRVKGGTSHTYSFHSQSYMGYTTDDLKLVPQVDESGEYVGTYAGADVPYGEDPNTLLNSSAYTTMYTRGYTWLDNVNRAEDIESGSFSVNFKQTDFNKQVSDSKDLNLKFTALNDWTPSDIGIMTGYAPRTSSNKNVPGLDYMLIHRTGDNLDTLFTSLIQPYKGQAYIKSAASLKPEVTDGTEGKDDTVKAVKVELTSGRTDYVIYATNNDVTYTVTDGDISFDFRGFVGVYSVNEAKENIYSYINDGDILKDMEALTEYTGKVVDFTKELTDDNSITVSFDTDVELENIVGRYIYINNTGSQNGVYRIEGAADGGQGNVVLDLDDVSLINGFVNTSRLDAGYTYNIAAKQTFRIPLSSVLDDAPVFTAAAEDLSTSAGSSITVRLSAESPLGNAVTYAGLVLPRGASINAETGVVTWKPSSSQIGDSGFMIAAIDEDGRESTISFEVTVYGSTTGSTAPAAGNNTSDTGTSDETDNTTTTPGSTGTSSGGGGGGGGSSGQGSTNGSDTGTDNNDKTDDGETPSVGDTSSSLGEGASGERFVDLGSHAWAADAINTLADDGIVKGTTYNTYSPANNITRADYALLLVRAFELASDDTANFDDVTASDYFASELAIARNTGIVNGIGDNKYAPRSTITRQDMMVIIYRALVALGKLDDTTNPVGLMSAPADYPDYADVAPYARDAVDYLISAGLVNGKNGLIAPTDYTTRAEVAVLLERILDYVK